MPDIIFVLIVEAALILFGAELLMRKLPKSLQEASSNNCYRIDGSWSSRRAGFERKAQRAIRSDLLAATLIVALTGNGLGLLVHNFVIPIPLGLHALSLFQTDVVQWKESINEHWIDRDYDTWNRGETLGGPDEVEAARIELWTEWPTVVSLGLGWLIASYWLTVSAYTHALRQFELGIKSRCEKHINLDITRLSADGDSPRLHYRHKSHSAPKNIA